METKNSTEQVVSGMMKFLNDHLVLTLSLTAILLVVLFLGSVKAGQNIGDAFWG